MDKKLLAEIEAKIPVVQSQISGWRSWLCHEANDTAGALLPVMRVVLEQQKEIDALKREVESLKRQ